MCIHGDLLEMKQMEPAWIRHYLQKDKFLHMAKCAGECGNTIEAIFKATPKANIFYCDEQIKGFDAPEDDSTKADMECGLILCPSCHVTCAERYNLEHAMEGSGTRRTSRRKQNR